jgi:hypothetical protein
MLRQDDLGAAVAEGILTETQARAPRAVALRREHERIRILRNKKGFRLMQLGLGQPALLCPLIRFTPAASARQLPPVSV